MKLKDKLNSNLIVPLVLAGIGVAIALPLHIFLNSPDAKESQKAIPVNPTSEPYVSEHIMALGRIQPKDKIITLSGSSSLQYVRVSQIFIKEGDKVKRGQVIAILDSLTKLQAALQQARLNAQFQNAQTEYLRFKNLYDEGAIAALEIDAKRLNVVTLQEQINEEISTLNQILSTLPKQISESQANLEKLKEVRPEDVRVAQIQFEQTKAAVLESEADLELAYVKSPIDGTVLKIHTHAGEGISSNGIVDLAQTKDMYVMAEVYETEIGKVKLGQKATISSSSLTKELHGMEIKL